MSQPITDDTLARWERMYSFTHPGDLEGERIRSLLVHIQALTAERDEALAALRGLVAWQRAALPYMGTFAGSMVADRLIAEAKAGQEVE